MTRVRRRMAVGLTVVALAVTACSSGLSARQKDVRSTKTVDLKQACSGSLCDGNREGAAFKIQLPHQNAWNGTLLIWSHGYRAAGPIPSNPLDPTSPVTQPDTSAEDGPSDEVNADLLAKGYALAGSAYKSNGWAVQDGVAADEDLYSYFSKTFGSPNRVYLWGASLGGLVTETLAERHPDWVSGVAPVCGVLGGTNLNLDLALDVAYAVKTLIDPQLQLTGFSSHDEAVDQWTAASQAVAAKAKTATPEAIADLLAIADLSGAPAKTDRYDGHDTTSTASAYVQAIVTALGYGTWGRYDIEHRVGGNPSTNVGVDYGARLTADERQVIDLAAPGQLDKVLQKLADGTRVQADATARQKADALGDPTGDLTRPTITMHTQDDPLVIVQNETVFLDRVNSKNDSGLLQQIYTGPPTHYTTAPYGAGHCNFTKNELDGVVSLLDGWVRYNQYPGPGAIQNTLDYTPDSTDSTKNNPTKIADGTATTGYLQDWVPGAWPAKSTS